MEPSWIAPPIASGLAIVPVYYGFVAKSAKQIGAPLPRMSVWHALKGGVRSMPNVGGTVGIQLIAQDFFEKCFPQQTWGTMLAGSVIVGLLTTPFSVTFNGGTCGKTAIESLRSISVKQTTAIVVRETSFLFALRISAPLNAVLKRHYGDAPYATAFVSGAVGGLIGHPADTLLTLEQNRMKVERLCQLMRGAPYRALSIGVFSVAYQFFHRLLVQKIEGRDADL